MAWLDTLLQAFDMTRPYLGGGLCLVGALLVLTGTVGILRFPDFFTRMHAASITDTAGATVFLVGMALLSPHWLVLVKLFVIWLLLFITGPTASHIVANAAYTAGLQPLIGRQAREETDEVQP